CSSTFTLFPYTTLFRSWLLSYAWSWKSDAERLSQIIDRLNVLPLGSGALAGNPFNIDREFLAKELGFNGIIQNSLYGVSDRDFRSEEHTSELQSPYDLV